MSEAIGIIPPPLGVQPNLTQPPGSIAKYNIITSAISLPIVSIVSLARIYTKLVINRHVVVEDYVSISSWLGSILYTGLFLSWQPYGAGIHAWDVPKSNAIPFGQRLYAAEVVYSPVVLVTKIAILLLYSRIFHPNRHAVIFIYVFIGVMVAYYVPNTFLKLFECLPVRKSWDKSVPGHCIDNWGLILSDCVVSLFSDFVILILPMPLIWRLKMPAKKKAQVTVVFTVGIFACIANVLRVFYTVGVNSEDYTYHLLQIVLWSSAEINAGIICACMPILPALLKHILHKYRSRRNSSNNSSLQAKAGSAHRRYLAYASSRLPKAHRIAPSVFAGRQNEMFSLDDLTQDQIALTGGVQQNIIRAEPHNRDRDPSGEGSDQGAIVRTVQVEQFTV